MKLSAKGQYAVLALVDLTRSSCENEAGTTVPLSEIAERQKISLNYLEQLFSKLRKANIVTSSRGHQGGYELARAATDITVLEVISAVDENIRTTRCDNAKTSCQGLSTRCLTHHLWNQLGEEIEGYLTATSLQNVLDSELPSRSFTEASHAA